MCVRSPGVWSAGNKEFSSNWFRKGALYSVQICSRGALEIKNAIFQVMRKQFWKQMRSMSLGSGVPSRLKSESVKRLKLCVSSSKLSELRLPDKALKHTCKRKLITADGIANKMSISSPVHRLLFAVCAAISTGPICVQPYNSLCVSVCASVWQPPTLVYGMPK